jgi:formate C-acetyltransferase
MLSSKYEFCIERIKYFTEIYKKYPEDPEILKRAKGIAHVLDNMTIFIRDDELLVGNETSKNLGEKINLDLYSAKDLVKKRVYARVAKRKKQSFFIKDEEIDELIEILPFWIGKTLYTNIINNRMKQEKLISEKGRFNFMAPNIAIQTGTNEGHICAGYENLLKFGFKGIIEQAESFQKLLKETDHEYQNKYNFYEAVKIYYNAAIRFLRRYSNLSIEMSLKEEGEERRKELETIGKTLNNLAEEPPNSFYGAIQCIWFFQNIANLIYYRSVLALGRLDQILWPYYQRDKMEDNITPEKALELIEELNLKLTWNVTFYPDDYALITNALGANTQTITISGLDKEGNDATNELSYLFLEAYKNIKSLTSDLSVRIHKNTPKEFFTETIKVFQSTSGIAFYNDDAIIPSMINAGYSLEDARNYVIVGCVEPTSQGNTFGATAQMFINLVGVLELTLNNGYSNFSKQIDGLETGNPAKLASYEEFYDALVKQLRFNIEKCVKIATVWDEEVMKYFQQPFVSSTLDYCLENGKDYTCGGTKYNLSSITAYGFATFVDSLYNLKKIVYDLKLMDLSEFIDILNADFEEREDFRQKLINKYEKWGNDKTEIDKFANGLWDLFCSEVIKHNSIRGGRFNPGAYSMGVHVIMGLFSVSSADGRKASKPLSNSLSPVNNVEKSGITATLNSIAKLNYDQATNGVAVNVRFHPLNIDSEEKIEKFYYLLKGYFDSGGMQLQPTIVSTETLKDAQKHPEKYLDLVVKVGGYNATFIDLGTPIQNDIINRLENNL